MWNTLTAGLQMVQEKLDNVLDDSQTQGEAQAQKVNYLASLSHP